MTYQALSLKYRPQTLDELIGQERVVKSLKAALQKGTIHHAYLFSGPRGVGKTSTARILAKSLNCKQGPTVNPCGTCANCIEIKEGRNIDVIEIDGASNRGIDEVRALRENVKFSPVNSRYKIYIIDEVHMLTEPAFNALLKTLEEPPQHVKFIFATTHIHKLPLTILSRCQKFSFSLLASGAIVKRLEHIALAEQVTVPDQRILSGIARAAGGSIRDAESIFDQILPVITEKDFLAHLYSFLGIIEESVLTRMAQHIARKDAPAALSLVDRLSTEGKDLSEFARDFIEYVRNILLVRIDKRFLDQLELSPESKEVLLKFAGFFSEERAVRIIEEFIEAQRRAKALNSLRIPLELALVKVCGAVKAVPAKAGTAPASSAPRAEAPQQDEQQPPRAGEVFQRPVAGTERKPEEKQGSPVIEERKIPSPFGPKAVGENTNVSPGSLMPRHSGVKEAQAEREPVAMVEEAAEALRVDGAFMEELKAKWNELAGKIKSKSMLLGSYLSKADVCSVRRGVLTCSLPKNLSFHKEHLEEKENVKILEGLLKEFLQREVKLKFVLDARVDRALEMHTKRKKDLSADTDVQAMQDIAREFGGKIIKENA